MNMGENEDTIGISELKNKRKSGPLGPSTSQKRKKATIFSLPDEALVKIASFLTQEDTLSLLYSNKGFERACKIRLYKRIVICEKYQDHYFYDLCKEKRITILSGWDNILAFFRMFYMKSQAASSFDASVCVEELVSYNFLDRGRIDAYRYLSNSDLANILQLRQFWSTVVNGFKNLKSFITPKLPLEKVFFLSPEIRGKLTKLSINAEDDSALGSLDNYDIELPNLRVLKLNFAEKFESTNKVLEIIMKIAFGKHETSNSKLEELEFNGCFGRVDRDTEHSLRHLNLTKDINLTSVFASGFECGRELLHPPPSGTANGCRGEEDELKTDSEDEEDGEKNDAQDQILEDIVKQYVQNTFLGEPEIFDPKNPSAETYMRSINDRSIRFDGLTQHDCKYLRLVLNRMASMGAKFVNLKKLTLSNFGFSRQDFEGDTSIMRDFQLIFPNFEDNIEVLEMRNLNHSILYQNRPPGVNYFENDGAPSLVSSFVDSPKIFPKLRKVFYYCFIDDHDLSTLLGMSSELPPDIPDLNPNKVQLEHLSRFISKAPLLEEIVVYSSKFLELRHFYRAILRSSHKKQLKKLTYTQPIELRRVARKILNVKVFKRFNSFSNLKFLDDYYFGYSKKLVEHFIKTTRVDNYDDTEDLLLHTEETELFKEDFKYLFLDDVKKFFRICPNLQEFTYYGYTFERKEVII